MIEQSIKDAEWIVNKYNNTSKKVIRTHTMMSRSQVLSIYKRILRVGQNWVAAHPDNTQVERNYIIDEAKTLFRKNATITDSKEASERYREVEARLAMAEHYRNPYPRPVNLPPGSYTKKEGKKTGTRIERLNEMSKPIYVKPISAAGKFTTWFLYEERRKENWNQ